MDRAGWRSWLKRWSGEWVDGHDPEQDADLDEDVVRDRWLGFEPASEAEVAAAEARLGRALPPSLREFLLVSNGWRDAGHFVYRVAGAAELEWLRDTDDAHWIDAYGGYADEGEPDVGEILGRSLRLSLEADAAVMLLDPEDVDGGGEWAGYWLASWSGEGPERFGSFYELMYEQYASFHSLRQPPGETRDHWDAEVERARRDALAGHIDEPLAILGEAGKFGRDRAGLLRYQMLAMLGEAYNEPLSGLVPHPRDEGLVESRLFSEELLPLLFAEEERFTLRLLMESGRESVQVVIAEYQARLRDAAFRLSYGNTEFDAAVHRIVGGLDVEADFHDPYGEIDEDRERVLAAAWPRLREAIELWRPVHPDHIAPVVLLADPVLAEMITPERGREILAMRRGELR